MPTDAIDLAAAVVHNSPRDVASWPATVQIERLTMRPGHDEGLSFEFSPRLRWPDYTPPGWTPGGEGLQYTVWAGCCIQGTWHVAGIIQMWRTRASTGAPILAQWRDWCYDVNRWGPMVGYSPRVGDEMVFFLTAGNARKGSAQNEGDVTSVRERSNVVMVKLPPGDVGTFAFGDLVSAHPASAGSPPASAGAIPPEGGAQPADFGMVVAELQQLTAQVRKLAESIEELKARQ